MIKHLFLASLIACSSFSNASEYVGIDTIKKQVIEALRADIESHDSFRIKQKFLTPNLSFNVYGVGGVCFSLEYRF
jgi:uncharacterized OsmC-like protein